MSQRWEITFLFRPRNETATSYQRVANLKMSARNRPLARGTGMDTSRSRTQSRDREVMGFAGTGGGVTGTLIETPGGGRALVHNRDAAVSPMPRQAVMDSYYVLKALSGVDTNIREVTDKLQGMARAVHDVGVEFRALRDKVTIIRTVAQASVDGRGSEVNGEVVSQGAAQPRTEGDDELIRLRFELSQTKAKLACSRQNEHKQEAELKAWKERTVEWKSILERQVYTLNRELATRREHDNLATEVEDSLKNLELSMLRLRIAVSDDRNRSGLSEAPQITWFNYPTTPTPHDVPGGAAVVDVSGGELGVRDGGFVDVETAPGDDIDVKPNI